MSEHNPWLPPEKVTICGQNTHRIEIDEFVDVLDTSYRDAKKLMRKEFTDVAEESLNCFPWMTKLGNKARAALQAAKGGEGG